MWVSGLDGLSSRICAGVASDTEGEGIALLHARVHGSSAHPDLTISPTTARYEDPDLLQNRPPLQQAIVISAGVIANVLLSFSLLLGSVATSGLPRPQFSEGPYVMKLVEKDCPAAKAGVQAEDLILAVNEPPVAVEGTML